MELRVAGGGAISGAGKLPLSAFLGLPALYASGVEQVVRVHGQLGVTIVKAKASGRPGPNAPTGDYRRSLTVQFRREGPLRFTAEIGTNKPQGRRLEKGFVGVDSLGRHYNQPPYPHFGPMMDELRPMFAAAMRGLRL